jgi:hypothetical protein
MTLRTQNDERRKSAQGRCHFGGARMNDASFRNRTKTSAPRMRLRMNRLPRWIGWKNPAHFAFLRVRCLPMIWNGLGLSRCRFALAWNRSSAARRPSRPTTCWSNVVGRDGALRRPVIAAR